MTRQDNEPVVVPADYKTGLELTLLLNDTIRKFWAERMDTPGYVMPEPTCMSLAVLWGDHYKMLPHDVQHHAAGTIKRMLQRHTKETL